MRRMLACVLGLLLLASLGQTAAAKTGAEAETARGAGAVWWRHSGSSGTLYYFDVYDFTSTEEDAPQKFGAFLQQVPCEVGRRGRPDNCDYRAAAFDRVKVDSFEIDPALMSAHALVHLGNRRGEVTWTGQGDYGDPIVFESVNQFLFPPYFVGAGAFAAVIEGRDASARGDLFGLHLTRREFKDAGMATFVYGSARACTGAFFC
jgi:hypothetical protein